MKNKKHGFGIYIYSDGSRFEGQWKNGQQDGIGYLVDKPGTNKKKGIWK